MEKIKVTVRVPEKNVRYLELIGARTEVINEAIEYFISAKKNGLNLNKGHPDSSGKRVADDDPERCHCAYSDKNRDRCGLKIRHEGPCLFFCDNPDCYGYEYPDRIKKHDQ